MIGLEASDKVCAGSTLAEPPASWRSLCAHRHQYQEGFHRLDSVRRHGTKNDRLQFSVSRRTMVCKIDAPAITAVARDLAQAPRELSRPCAFNAHVAEKGSRRQTPDVSGAAPRRHKRQRAPMACLTRRGQAYLADAAVAAPCVCSIRPSRSRVALRLRDSVVRSSACATGEVTDRDRRGVRAIARNNENCVMRKSWMAQAPRRRDG